MLEFYVAGVQFRPEGATTIKNLEEGDELDLVPEPTNKYDPNAIQIVADGKHIGYVPRKFSAEVAAMLEVGTVGCFISEINPSAKQWEMCKVRILTETEMDDPGEEEDDYEDDDEFDDDPGELKENEDFARDNEFEREDED